MNLLLLWVIFLLGTTGGSDYNYDNFKICKTATDSYTDELFLECMCENRENLTVDSIFDFSITRIIVKGCGEVQIPFASLTNLQLHKIEFADLHKLTILPFALSSIQGVSTLKISDVAELNIIQHAFVGLYNIDKFILKNVTANKLMRDAFSAISTVNLFLVEDCSFDEIQQFAFAIQNVTIFNAVNTSFSTMENYSLLLHNAEEVIFESCTFNEMDNGSFVFSFVDFVYYRNCHFLEIETTAFHSNPLNLFSITNSDITILKPDAFGGLDTQQFVFTDNTIPITYETSFSSLLTLQSEGLSVSYCCNSFTCDCNIYWMWGLKELDENNTLLQDSFCISETKKPVTFYKPILDSYNNCMTFEMKLSPKGKSLEDSVEAKIITTDCINDDCPLNDLPSSSGRRITFAFQALLCTFIIIMLL